MGSSVAIGQTQDQAVEKFEAVLAPEIVPRAGFYGITELMMACIKGETNVVKSLIRAGVNVNEKDNWGSTALSAATYNGHMDIVEILVSEGAELDVVSSRVTTAIGNAMMSRHTDVVMTLLEAGAAPNIPRIYGATLLEYAIRNDQLELVEPLLVHGADIGIQGPAALLEATKLNDERLVLSLLKSGANADQPTGPSKMTPLYYAVVHKNPELVRAILDAGADPNRLTNEGRILNKAIANGNVEIVEMLLKSGAEVYVHQLSAPVRDGNAAMLDILMDSIDNETIDDWTFEELLASAHAKNNQAVVEALWRAGANAPGDDSSVLLIYRRYMDSNCNFFVWDPQTNSHRPIYESADACEGGFFVSSRNRTFVNLRADALHILPVDPQQSMRMVPLPVDLIDQQLKDLISKVNVTYQKHGSTVGAGMTAVPVAAGTLENGDIALLVTSDGPADETYAFLFGLFGDQWIFLEDIYCERLAPDCSFSQFEGRAITNWAPQRAAWHANIRGNPYFVRKISLPADDNTGYRQGVQFNISDQEVRLSYETGSYDYCGGACLYTVGLELRLDGRDPHQLSANQNSGHNAISNHYVLMRRQYHDSGYSTEVIDMRDGSSVFGLLGPASWIN